MSEVSEYTARMLEKYRVVVEEKEIDYIGEHEEALFMNVKFSLEREVEDIMKG